MSDTQINWGKIKWQSRRGMRELDLMLLPFVEHDLPKMDASVIDDYMDLLNLSDLELFRLLHGTAHTDNSVHQNLINIIIQCHEGRKGVEGV